MSTARELARRGEPVVELGPASPDRPPSLRVCVVAPEHGDGEALLAGLREASSKGRMRELGCDQGYRIEDAEAFAVAGDAAMAAWLSRRLGQAVEPVEGPRLALAAVFAGRIGRPPERPRYLRAADGRVRVEAFELHVTEHCNLRCANCCNMSPLVAEKTLSVEEVAAFTGRMAGALSAEVIKIMGGEPLLHPQITRVLHVLRESGIGDRVRLFTNGLLLHAQKDDFWEALDELTISNYSSAPLKPAILELARERARRHDIVLNIKPVDEFTQVLSPRFERDDARVQRTFDRCWLRHRCLVVRAGRFYTCTRAAYAGDFLERVSHEPPPWTLDRSGDGISIDARRHDAVGGGSDGSAGRGGRHVPPDDEPDLASALLAYLNRQQPLAACRYCFGGDGVSEPHHQLTRAEVKAGVLSRRLAVLP